MTTRRVFAGVISIVFLAGAAFAAPAPVHDLEARLAASVAAGSLEPAVADLYRLYAVVAAERLPAELRTEAAEGAARRLTADGAAPQLLLLRCGTPLLRAVRSRLDTMAPEGRAEAEALLDPARPGAERAAAQVGGKAIAHVLANWVLTPNFSIEWGSALTNEDGSLPLRDVNLDGVPDVVECWAELFEASFDTVARVLKPDAPGSVYAGTAVATNRIPVYLGNSSPTSTIENIASGTYAFTQDASPIPYIVVNNDLRFVPANEDPEGRLRGAMKITAPHEFFHVIHFLYEPGAWVPSADDWWLETSATWMEDELFDGVNDYHQYYGPSGWTAFVEAGLPVVFGSANYVTRAYGGAIFGKYLGEHVGGQGMMGELWDLIRPSPAPGRRILDALDAYAAGQGLGDAERLFLGFSAANAVMDYEEGNEYGSVPIRNTGNLTHAETLATLVPDYLGATYLLRSVGGPGPVTVSLSGNPRVRWGLSLVAKRAGGYSVALGADGASGAASLSLANLGVLDELYAVPSFLAPPPATSMSYSTTESAVPAIDTAPPGPPAGLIAVAAPGGFDASWLSPVDADVAGYVVRWRRTGALLFANRTVVEPVQSIEVRGLVTGDYEIEVFAYDQNGNADPAAADAAAVTVALAGADAPIPAFAAIFLELQLGEEPPAGGGGGGGGGGGCFLDSLCR